MKKRAEFLRVNAHVTKLNVDELSIMVREFIEGHAASENQPATATNQIENYRQYELEPVG